MNEPIVLASANPDKAAEIRTLMKGFDLRPRPADVPDVEETGTTLEENARLKAQALVDATGLAAVADDTGLEVHALDGAPGVYSARFAGEHSSYSDNVEKLLRSLEGVDRDHRQARFRTVALFRRPDGTEVIGEGVVDGFIALHPSGENGFGYDPLFIPAEGDGRTFAEMTSVEKNAVSHRGRAFRKLAELLGDA